MTGGERPGPPQSPESSRRPVLSPSPLHIQRGPSPLHGVYNKDQKPGMQDVWADSGFGLRAGWRWGRRGGEKVRAGVVVGGGGGASF